jgi:hypothetical protein
MLGAWGPLARARRLAPRDNSRLRSSQTMSKSD